MAKPAVKTVVTRDLRKMLAVLSRVVQDACAAVSVAIFIRNPQAVLLLAARRTPRSLSDLGRTNSLCKTARTNTEIKGGQNLISSQRACPSEANRRCYIRFHSKSSGGFAVSSRSDISVRPAASPTGCLGGRP